MIQHSEISNTDLRRKISENKIRLGGNKKLRIYGTLSCKSGKRMKKEHRVFFISEKEATDNGYRPCGHCMKDKYQKWQDGLI
jgi:methylphosphotriester-DNA--protein-cysteine methyltransferase